MSSVKIIPTFTRAREIKQDGADIEEVLRCYSVDEIKEQILGSDDEKVNKKDVVKNSNSNSDTGLDNPNDCLGYKNPPVDNGYPFQILGIADDSRAYFLDSFDRMVSYKTSELNGNILSDLGTLNWFKNNVFHCEPTKKDWAGEVDAVRILSKNKDFDLDKVKGRGAWRTKGGELCYYDGKKITGKPDSDWVFVRKNQKPAGINQNFTDAGKRAEIMRISKKFTLKTPADNIRLLSWAVLAHFGGCLKWRPMILSTGESGWGKSTIMDYVVSPIALYTRVNGTTTTEAAVRQYNGIDSYPIYVEEAEAKKKKPKDQDRIEGIFALGRGSSTDDAPKTIKGSANGTAVVYEMKSMFSFTAVNASIDNDADDNRIIKINFKPPTNKDDFLDNIQEIIKLLDLETCNGIRAFTWHNLQNIIKLGDRLFIIIQRVTGQNARFAAGESILLSANLIVWDNMPHDLPDEDLKAYIQDFYKNQTIEPARDETDEMVQTILDETIIFGNDKTTHSIRELLIDMKKYLDKEYYTDSAKWQKINQTEYVISKEEYLSRKRAVEQCGLTVHKPTREMGIAISHGWIMRKLNISRGYQRQLSRHKNVVEYRGEACPTMTIDSGTKRAVIISGALEYAQPEEKPDDKPF